MMTVSEYRYQSDFAKGYFAEGEAIGKAEGKAEAVLLLLRKRQVPVSAAAHARIQSCTDVVQLDTWFDRAFTADNTDQLFR